MVEGFDQHSSKGYIYSATAFSVLVEILNIKVGGAAAAPVKLYAPYADA